MKRTNQIAVLAIGNVLVFTTMVLLSFQLATAQVGPGDDGCCKNSLPALQEERFCCPVGNQQCNCQVVNCSTDAQCNN